MFRIAYNRMNFLFPLGSHTRYELKSHCHHVKYYTPTESISCVLPLTRSTAFRLKHICSSVISVQTSSLNLGLHFEVSFVRQRQPPS